MTQLFLMFALLQKKVKRSKEIKVINTLLVIVVSKIHSTPNNFSKQLLHVHNKSLIILDIQQSNQLQCLKMKELHVYYSVVFNEIPVFKRFMRTKERLLLYSK
jgi:hypothetical protein